tara:strand:- start:808 stop:3336 length:2529 start_codon:yes stop_codon:yes gene_type:complete
MNKYFLIIFSLFFYSCDDETLVQSPLTCDSGAEFSLQGFHCGDLSILQDIIDANSSLSDKNISDIALPEHFNISGRLIYLNLYNRSITSLTESIGDLEYLQELRVQNNQISILPDSIERLSDLRYLDASNNLLTSIPSSGIMCSLDITDNYDGAQGVSLSGNILCEKYNYQCDDYWYWENDGISQNHSNCCIAENESGDLVPNLTECIDSEGECLVEIDECGTCGGVSGCSLPEDTVFITSGNEIIYNFSSPVNLLQVHLNGLNITELNLYQDAYISDFNQSTFVMYYYNNFISGCGSLGTIVYDGEIDAVQVGVSQAIGQGGHSGYQYAQQYINYYGDCGEYNYLGCTDELACNYLPMASQDDDSCEYESDCSGSCGGSAELDGCGICDGDGSTCFGAAITLSDNSQKVEGAEVFMRYDLGPYQERGRASQVIEYALPEDAYVELKEYDLEDNLISTHVSENKSAGYYSLSRNFSSEESRQIAPFGINVTKLVLELGLEELISYPVLMAGYDFNMLQNLGNTDSNGEIVLASDTKSWFPHLYSIPSINNTDESGNELGTFNPNDYTNQLQVIFFHNGEYRLFDTTIEDSFSEYNFEWGEGAYFSPNVNFSNDSFIEPQNSPQRTSGDVDGDGTVNILDVLIIAQHLIGELSLSGNQLIDGDMNQDGVIGILDISIYLEAILGGGRGVSATSASISLSDDSISMTIDGYVDAVMITLSHGTDFSIDLTDNAFISEYHSNGDSTTMIILGPEFDDLATISGSYNLQSISVVANGNFICDDVSIASTEEGTTIIVVDGQEIEIVAYTGDFIIVENIIVGNDSEMIDVVVIPSSLQLMIYPNPFN